MLLHIPHVHLAANPERGETQAFISFNAFYSVVFENRMTTYEMEQQHRLDALLTGFGQSLRSSGEFYREGAHLANKVFEKLKRHSKFSVARVYFGGSFGKKTDVIECDLDLHVVLNDFDPSRDLDKVLNDFEDLLTLHEDQLQIQGEIERNHKRSLSFQFQNGIPVDLLPASNIDERELMRMMVKDPKNKSYVYNPSFVAKQIAFMKSQTGFTHTLIRLAKFWFKSLYLGEEFKGGSAMIEAISAAVAEEEENGIEDLSMFRAFTKVINRMKKVDTLKLAFVKVAEGRWERVQERDFQNRGIIPEIVGTWKILQRKGFIIDPANSFQDFLERNSTTVIEKLKSFAGITRQRLSQLVEKNCGEANFISKLFEPQPLNLTTEPSMRLPYDFHISYQNPCHSSLCDMKVRNEKVLKDPKVQLAVEALKANLLTVVNGIVKGVEDAPPTSIPARVCNAVDTFIEGSLQSQLGPTAEDRHAEMDITLSVPYWSQGKCYAVRFSGKWAS